MPADTRVSLPPFKIVQREGNRAWKPQGFEAIGACVDGVKAVLHQIVEALVDDCDSIEIVTRRESGTTGFRLRVGSADVGKLIEKQGRTARSIRTILPPQA